MQTGRRQWRRWVQAAMVALMVAGWMPSDWWLHGPSAQAQVDDGLRPQIAPRAAAPLAEPVVRADAHLRAGRVTAFVMGTGKGLLLEGGVAVQVGVYGFRGDRAVVRIDEEAQPGRVIKHLSVYFENARSLRTSGRTAVHSPRLLVTAATVGDVELTADLLQRSDRPPADPFVHEAEGRFERYFTAVAARTLPVPDPDVPLFGDEVMQLREARRAQIAQERVRTVQRVRPVDEPTLDPTQTLVRRTTTEDDPDLAPPDDLEPLVTPPEPPTVRRVPRAPGEGILPADASVSFTAERIVFEEATDGRDESMLLLVGQVRVFYQDLTGQRSMTLSAEKAVIFIAAEGLSDLAGSQIDADAINGVYLEDNVVATDGTYTVRAPRVFYDVPSNRAVLLDAVLYTWDVRSQVPLYLRAEQLRQESQRHWTAERARLTTSEFAEPHFAIGASRLNLEQRGGEGGQPGRYGIEAKDLTLRWGPLPFFYWPHVAAEAGRIPLKQVGGGYSQRNGLEVETRWDLFALLGQESPPGVELSLDLDYLGRHGAGLGLELDYKLTDMFGNFRGYFLPLDDGSDELGGRRDIDRDNDMRGFARWQHRQYLRGDWELSLEGAYVSEETFLEVFFPSEAATAKPYENSIYLKKQEEQWALTFLTQYNLDNFVHQTAPLQTFGYDVAKLPELGFHIVGLSLWNDRLTYYTENRASRVEIQPSRDGPGNRGFRDALSMELFGIPAATSFRDRLAAQGVPFDTRTRLDSRHELQAPLKLAMFDIVPYVAGRATFYDDDFRDYAGEDDNLRLMGMTGVRLHTQFSRTDDQFENRLFDLHRLRHIVEPSVDLFYIGSNINPEDIPVYDVDVERLSEGAGVRFGLRNTFQTQRGGPGRWRSVDWLTINTDFVFRSRDAQIDEPLPRFFAYRPEYSIGGDHFHTDVLWMISDTLGFVGDLDYSFEHDRVAQYRVGLTLDHTPRLSWFTTYGEIDALDSRLLTYGFTYQMTTKYTLSISHTLDLGRRDSRNIDAILERRLPRWRLRVIGSIDEVNDDQSISVVLIPEGFGGPPAPLAFGRGR